MIELVFIYFQETYFLKIRLFCFLIHKKTKVVERKRTKSKQVNAFRLVLYTFRADPAYPEQVTVLQDQLIYTAEDCGDGWSV